MSTPFHDSDCAIHSSPAYPAGECDCHLAEIAKWEASYNAVCDEPVACPSCQAAHAVLDADESKIIRNAKDGYPDGRAPRELTLVERVSALCIYAADWKRWCLEKETAYPQSDDTAPATDVALLRQSEREGWRYADELEQQRKADTALLRQALEALELTDNEAVYGLYRDERRQVNDAIAAIRTRLSDGANPSPTANLTRGS